MKHFFIFSGFYLLSISLLYSSRPQLIIETYNNNKNIFNCIINLVDENSISHISPSIYSLGNKSGASCLTNIVLYVIKDMKILSVEKDRTGIYFVFDKSFDKEGKLLIWALMHTQQESLDQFSFKIFDSIENLIDHKNNGHFLKRIEGYWYISLIKSDYVDHQGVFEENIMRSE